MKKLYSVFSSFFPLVLAVFFSVSLAGGGFPLNWEQQGPFDAGGRCRAFLIDNKNSNVFYAASTGGLWRSVNKGQSWTLVSNSDANSIITSVTQGLDGSIYYGTGEYLISGYVAAFQGTGVFRAADGINFSSLNSTSSGVKWKNVNCLAGHNKTNRIFAGNDGGLFYSDDNGQTWNNAVFSGAATGWCEDIKVASDGAVYAVVGHRLYRSKDGSSAFEKKGADSILGIFSRVTVAVSPQDPATVYVAAAYSRTSPYSGSLHSLYRSENAGQSFKRLISGPFTFNPMGPLGSSVGEGFYAFALSVDPRNKRRVYVGGWELGVWEDSARIIASTEEGNPAYMIPSKHFVAFDTTYSPAHMIVGTDKGLYRSTDQGKSFHEMNKGMSGFRINSLAMDRVGNCLFSTEFTGVYFQEKFKAPVKLTDLYALRTEISRWNGAFFMMGEYGGLKRSNYKGALFSSFYDASVTANSASFRAETQFNFWESEMDSSSLLIVPQGGSVFITAGATNFSQTPVWHKLLNGSNAIINTTLSHDANYLYVATSSGIYRVNNLRSVNFAALGQGQPLPGSITIDTLPAMVYPAVLALDRNDSNKLLVVSYGSAGGEPYLFNNIFSKTPSYQEIKGNLDSNISIRCAMFSGTLNGAILMGTDDGVYATENSGQHWSLENQGMRNIAVVELREHNFTKLNGQPSVSRGTLSAATYGAGYFISTNLSVGIGTSLEKTGKLDLKLFPNPSGSQATLEFTLARSAEYRLSLTDINGRLLLQELEFAMAGTHQVHLNTGGMPCGIYFVKVESQEFSGYQKLIVAH